MTTNYDIMVNGEVVATMGGDFSQASCSLTMDGDSTPFQVADARHRKLVAAKMLLIWAWGNGGSACEMDDDGQPVGDIAVMEVESVESADAAE